MATTAVPHGLKRITDRTVRYVRENEKAITFAEFLEMYGPKDYVELVKGAVVEKAMVQWDHEQLQSWLVAVLRFYVDENKLGAVAGSRTAVQISMHGGRLPDFLFIRRERLDIVEQKAIYGPPDLVIELRSPSNTGSDIVALESDYCSIGVPEIVFIDQAKRQVRVIRKRGDKYQENILTQGVIHLESVEGFWLRTEWLFEAPRITVPEALAEINRGTGKD